MGLTYRININMINNKEVRIGFITCSPFGNDSHSVSFSHEIVQSVTLKIPHTTITEMDLIKMDLPSPSRNIEYLTVKFKKFSGQEMTPAEQMAWTTIKTLVDTLNSADIWIIATPMWNFGIPYKLKQFIDVITQPGLLFYYTEQGYPAGLIQNKLAVIVSSSGGDYSEEPMSSFNCLNPYLDVWLRFIGFTDILECTVAGTAAPPEIYDASLAKSRKQLPEISGQIIQFLEQSNQFSA